MKHALILACALLSACAAPMVEQRLSVPKPAPVKESPALKSQDLALIAINGCAV